MTHSGQSDTRRRGIVSVTYSTRTSGQLVTQTPGRGPTVYPLIFELMEEVERQDAKHGPYEGTILGRSRLALATLEDEVDEARHAWRSERRAANWNRTRAEVLQVAAVAIRTLRDAL